MYYVVCTVLPSIGEFVCPGFIPETLGLYNEGVSPSIIHALKLGTSEEDSLIRNFFLDATTRRDKR